MPLLTPSPKMEIIQSIFRHVQENYSESLPLDNYEPEFLSIAYEAASMCIALEGLKKEKHLKKWFDFLYRNPAHTSQIHVGLGWALAQNKISPIDFFQQMQPEYHNRISDGYGYYEGIFNKRKSILNQQQPEWNNTAALNDYDQGLGRSLWYIHQGNIVAAKSAIKKFPAARHGSLWRGLGIAIAYVGGFSEEMIREIFKEAAEHKPYLADGIERAWQSRKQSGCFSEDTELVYQLLDH